MRRQDREKRDIAFMHQVLKDAREIYLAFNTGEIPYVLPMNFVFHQGHIYFHCALEGRKLHLIKENSGIGFTAAVDIKVEGTTTRYRSVCGTGHAIIVDNQEEKIEALKALAQRFNAPCTFPVPEAMDARTLVVRIEIQEIAGKQSASL